MTSAPRTQPATQALAPIASRPAARELPTRQREVVELATSVLEREGADALTMRRLAAGLGIQAPSLYKHVTGRAELELLMVELALVELGDACHAAVSDPGGGSGPVASLLQTYRRYGLDHPELYRIATGRGFPRAGLTPGLEDWAGEPFYRATGDPAVAQALWAFAHGLVILEIDARLQPADHDATWAAGALAFAS